MILCIKDAYPAATAKMQCDSTQRDLMIYDRTGQSKAMMLCSSVSLIVTNQLKLRLFTNWPFFHKFCKSVQFVSSLVQYSTVEC